MTWIANVKQSSIFFSLILYLIFCNILSLFIFVVIVLLLLTLNHFCTFNELTKWKRLVMTLPYTRSPSVEHVIVETLNLTREKRRRAKFELNTPLFSKSQTISVRFFHSIDSVVWYNCSLYEYISGPCSYRPAYASKLP